MELPSEPLLASEVTQLIRAAETGDSEAKRRLVETVYSDLRRLAGYLMQAENPAHTLQPTALVNQYLLKLLAETGISGVESRRHLIATAAKAMRHLLVDHARAKQAGKRGAGVEMVAIQAGVDGVVASDEKLLLIHDALDRLAKLNPRQSTIAEMRIFGGFSIGEIAESLGVTTRTVDRDWGFAKGFLQIHLK